MIYRRCGNSGILLPAISLGLWHNFGGIDDFEKGRTIILEAFEKGICHFDLANTYGPPPGSAETNFGKILRSDFEGKRDQLLITTKAGHPIWEGVYGNWASRKHLVASCDQSLKRLGLDYVDIFYSHRYDPDTPLEETMQALDYIVRSGRALYAGLSKYPADKMQEAMLILRNLGTPALVTQLRYSLLNREPEADLFPLNETTGTGCVTFSPLAQGQLTDRYLNGIPAESRAAKPTGFLKTEEVEQNIDKVRALKQIADRRGQSLSNMALSWQLTDHRVTSVIVGVSSVEQLRENLQSLSGASFSEEELQQIDAITLR